MKMDSATTLSPAAKPAPADTTEIFLQLGSITRLLHDTLKQLGVMPKLQQAADGLPDARSRLNYIATKTAQAAEKVLNSVDQAKAEHVSISEATRRMAQAITADPVKAVASGAVFNFVQDVEQRTAKIDDHLTDIMMAQDFHDLTGQVVAKVVTLAGDLEDSLTMRVNSAAVLGLGVAPNTRFVRCALYAQTRSASQITKRAGVPGAGDLWSGEASTVRKSRSLAIGKRHKKQRRLGCLRRLGRPFTKQLSPA